MTSYPNWFPVERCDGCGYMAQVVEMPDGTLVCCVCWEDEE